MSDKVSGGGPGWITATIVNWRALSFKRLVHLDELERSGRWRRHFPNREAFEDALRKANTDAERWKQLADHKNAPDPQFEP